MHNPRRFLIKLILFFTFQTQLLAQDGMHSSGGDGTGSGGTFSFSFGQFAYETFFDGMCSMEQGVQHPFEAFVTEKIVPNDFELANTPIGQGEVLCFNALENISVAGIEGPVEIQPTASVQFIAGKSILFLPGFHAMAGSTVQGRITITNDFCEGYKMPSIVHAPPIVEKSIELNQPESQSDWLTPNMGVKVFPNPNNGRFRVELLNFDNKACVFVYNQLGIILYQAEINNNGSNEIELPVVLGGLYFVRVVEGKKQFVNKIIVQ